MADRYHFPEGCRGKVIPAEGNGGNRYQNAGKNGNDGKGNGKRREREDCGEMKKEGL